MSAASRDKTEAALSLLLENARKRSITIQFMGEPLESIEVIHVRSGDLAACVLVARDGSLHIQRLEAPKEAA